MLVTNKLASLFIEENLKAREIQAEGTSEFISKELVAMEAQLKKQDQTIRSYRERNMGNLPSQLDANLRILERLHEQLRTTNEAIKTSEDRAFLIQEQIEKLKRYLTVPVKTPGARKEQGQDEESIQEHPLSTQLDNLRRELEIAQSKYTETHPDIIDMKKKIGVLEIKLNIALKELEAKKIARQKELKARQDRAKVTAEDLSETIIDPTVQGTLEKYTNQLNEVQIEAKRIRGEAKNIKEQIAIYQKRIEDTPKKEEELALLTRDYDLLMKNYQSLSDKRIQSRMAENLERRQQGEQFKILDPAQLPEIPIKPDFAKTMAMGAVFGLFAGIGLVWFRETWNQKFHNEADVESYLRIPVIAVIPNLKEDKG
jgi:uncharacterized protein involved in exopolysaccharide biosynthesis